MPLPRGWTRAPAAGSQTSAGDVVKAGCQKVPQQISVHNLQLVESSETERDAESDPIICTVLPPYTVSPGSGTPLPQPLDQDSDVLQHFSNGKYQQIERAQHPPFGDAQGHMWRNA